MHGRSAWDAAREVASEKGLTLFRGGVGCAISGNYRSNNAVRHGSTMQSFPCCREKSREEILSGNSWDRGRPRPPDYTARALCGRAPARPPHLLHPGAGGTPAVPGAISGNYRPKNAVWCRTKVQSFPCCREKSREEIFSPTLPLREGRNLRAQRSKFRGGVAVSAITPPRKMVHIFRPSLKGRVERAGAISVNFVPALR